MTGAAVRAAPVYLAGAEIFTGYGLGVHAAFDGVTGSSSSMRPVTRFDTGALPTVVGGFDGDTPDELELLSRCVELAASQAGLGLGNPGEPVPLFLGLSAITGGWSSDPAKSSPSGMAAALAGRLRGLRVGRIYTNACVASTCAVIEASAAVRAGRCRHAIAATVRLVDRQTFHLFGAAGALSPSNLQQPFGAGRDGLLLGDGAGAVVVTSEPCAAPVRVAGWGMSGDAHHANLPDPSGGGQAAAMSRALADAGLSPVDVVLVNSHGTATLANDLAEYQAYRTVWGGDLEQVRFSSTKSSTGHCLEATGLLETVLLATSMTRATVPANRLSGEVGAEFTVRPVTSTSPCAPVVAGLTVNSAFGGANAALVLASV